MTDRTGSSAGQYRNHARDFLDCIKSRKTPVSDVTAGHRVAVAVPPGEPVAAARPVAALGREGGDDPRRRRGGQAPRAAVPQPVGQGTEGPGGVRHMTDRREFLAASAALFAGTGRADDAPKSPLGIVIHSYPVRSRDKGFSRPAGLPATSATSAGRPASSSRWAMLSGRPGPRAALDGREARHVRRGLDPPAEGQGRRRALRQGDRHVEGVRGDGGPHRHARHPAVRDVPRRQGLRRVRRAGPRPRCDWPSRWWRSTRSTLAVENHKDFRTDELVGVMKAISSEHVGVCVDTGNSIALLERPTDTADGAGPVGAGVPPEGHGRRGIGRRLPARRSPARRRASWT